MRDPESRTKRDFSHFDTMSTAELRSVIHHDSMLDENEASDMDAILYIMEVLAKRDKEENEYIETDAAWQSFKTDYYPYASDGEPLFSADDGEDTAPVRRRKFARLIKPLSIAAILALVLLAGTVTSYAFGYDIWGAFANWTHETFHFSSEKNSEENLPFKNLKIYLEMYKISERLAPNWLPDEYGEDIVTVDELSYAVNLGASCSDGDNTIIMKVSAFTGNDTPLMTYEQLKDTAEVYASGGIEHYITVNGNEMRVYWINAANECSILCNFEREEIYRMIDSIYER